MSPVPERYLDINGSVIGNNFGDYIDAFGEFLGNAVISDDWIQVILVDGTSHVEDISNVYWIK